MSSASDGYFGWPAEPPVPEPERVPASADVPTPNPIVGFPLAEHFFKAEEPASWDGPRHTAELPLIPAPVLPAPEPTDVFPVPGQAAALPSSGTLGAFPAPSPATILPVSESRRARKRPVSPSPTEPGPLATKPWPILAAALGYAVLGLALIAGVGPVAMMFAVVVFAIGWPALIERPNDRGASVVVGVTGALAILALTLTTTEPRLRWLALCLATGVFGAVIHQLVRSGDRDELVQSLAGEITGVVLVVGLSAPLALSETGADIAGMAIWAGAGTAAVLTQLLPRAVGPRVLFGLTGAALAGAVLGQYAGFLGAVGGRGVAGALAGLVIGGATSLMMRIFATLPAAGTAPAWLAAAVAPIAGSGVLGYIVLRLLLG